MAGEAKKKQHFVMVHGSCHGAWCWYKVKRRLEEGGHRVTVLDMAASGINLKSIEDVSSCEEYSQPLMEFLSSSSCEDKVVLVGHSFGGMSLAFAMDKRPHKVAVTVFLTAFMPDTTHPPSHVLDKFVSSTPPEAWLGTKFEPYGSNKSHLSMLFSREFMEYQLYQLSPAEDLELGLILRRPGSLFVSELSKVKRFTEEGYGSVPRVYVVCKEDKGIPVQHQRWMIENFKPDRVIEMNDTDHMPMFSKPHQLCDHLLQVANMYA